MAIDTPIEPKTEPSQIEPAKTAPAPVDPEVIKAEEVAEKTHTSKGEKAFDLLTYGGIAFAGVFVATLPWTYWTKYGGGKKIHSWVINTSKKYGASEPLAENIFSTLVLGALGNAAVVPIKMMENLKPKLVEKFNTMLGDKSADASVDEEPKQTWGSLIKSRVAAYTACFVSLQAALHIFGEKKFKAFEEGFAEKVVCGPLGKPTHIPGMAKIAANETKAFRYGKIGALDVFATAAATILLYTGSKFFAKQNQHWHAQHAHVHQKPTEPEAATPPAIALNPPQPEPEETRLHTQSIAPRSNEIALRSRPDRFVDALGSQKSSTSEPSALVGV